MSFQIVKAMVEMGIKPKKGKISKKQANAAMATAAAGDLWNQQGNYAEYERLFNLIPSHGKAPTAPLEVLRVISNLYYDWYNNGWDNIDNKTEDIIPAESYLHDMAGQDWVKLEKLMHSYQRLTNRLMERDTGISEDEALEALEEWEKANAAKVEDLLEKVTDAVILAVSERTKVTSSKTGTELTIKDLNPNDWAWDEDSATYWQVILKGGKKVYSNQSLTGPEGKAKAIPVSDAPKSKIKGPKGPQAMAKVGARKLEVGSVLPTYDGFEITIKKFYVRISPEGKATCMIEYAHSNERDDCVDLETFMSFLPLTESKVQSQKQEAGVVNRIEKKFNIKMLDGRNSIEGYPFDVDAKEDPSEGGLTMQPVDKDALKGLRDTLKQAGFKVATKRDKLVVGGVESEWQSLPLAMKDLMKGTKFAKVLGDKGVCKLDAERVAEISLVDLGYANHYAAYRVNIIGKKVGEIAAHTFKFKDHLQKRLDNRKDYTGGFYIGSNNRGLSWYIAIPDPQELKAMMNEIEEWVENYV